ncbi:MAG: acetyl-CoA carboxylase biotin carboxyl carrier protein [Candidatus Omnitrophota bacterium]
MNLKEIKEVIELMNENDLTEIEIEKNGLKLRLSKGQKSVVQQTREVSMEIARAEIPEAKASAVSPSDAVEKYLQIKAPMVGTFYRAASPDSSPFLEVGAVVNPGDVVCIIEAMKLMNEIKSEIKGKIKEILVDNGEPVEFDQPLFLVEP